MADTDKTTTPTLERTPEIVFEPKNTNGSSREFTALLNGKPIVIYRPWWQRATAPLSVLFMAIVLMVALVFYGMGASATNHSSTATSDTNTASSSNMGNMPTSNNTNTANVPNATQQYGNQPATYTIDPDGAKHFTFTAQQVMWEVIKGQRVLAWTINGTVPGPMIRITSGDHIRVTFINHFPKPTAIHWHGLLVPEPQDGVPGLGQKPIAPGQTYVYDFTVGDQDVGTHWYHSHYDDMEQVAGGFYGAFIVDPRPGTKLAEQATIKADVEYTEFISTMPGGWYVINGKSFPDTQPVNVKHGQTVHIRFIGADTMMMHPMHIHGHTFNLVAQDGHMLPQPTQLDTIPVVPGETYDLTFYAWAAPGSIYPIHCHILSHLMNPGQTGEEMGGLITLIEYAK